MSREQGLAGGASRPPGVWVWKPGSWSWTRQLSREPSPTGAWQTEQRRCSRAGGRWPLESFSKEGAAAVLTVPISCRVMTDLEKNVSRFVPKENICGDPQQSAGMYRKMPSAHRVPAGGLSNALDTPPPAARSKERVLPGL